MGLDDYFDRKKIEVFTIKPEVKAMTRKERLELLNRLFMEEYQGKFVTYEMLEQDLFVETNGRTRKHFSYKGPGTTHKEHQAKINICASGGYWDMISDADYYGSKPEKSRIRTLSIRIRLLGIISQKILCVRTIISGWSLT